MNNTILLYFASLVTLASVSCNSPRRSSAEETKGRPNVIFIFSDDHAFNAIGAYGNKLAKTPNIDRIATEGAVFQNFFVTNSICGPSRAALLTGKYGHINGFMANEAEFDVSQFMFSRTLSESGYQTAWIGKWHLGTLPGDSFDYWNILEGQGTYFRPAFINPDRDTISMEGYVTDVITQLSTDWLDKRDKDKPFFLVVGEKATHREWFPDLQDLGAYDSVDFPLPETFYDDYDGRIAAGHQEMGIADIMRMDLDLKVDVDYDKDWPFTQLNAEQKAAYKAYYQDKISKEFHDLQLTGNALAEWKFQRYVRDYMSTANSLDRNIGKLLDYLDANGLAENTIVVYGSDQGFYLGEHGWFDKRFMYEESLRTPFVIRYPGVVKPGTVINQSVANIDWAPTFMEIAGVTVPNDIHGVSFLPILRDNEAVGRDAVYYHYYEYPQPHRVMSHFGVRTDRYKLVRFYGKQNFWELYDLREDPTEIHNLYGDVAYDSVITDLKGKLDQLIKTYKDTEAARVLAEK